MAINQFPQVMGGGDVASVNTHVGVVVLTAADVGAEAYDSTILKDANIGVSVQEYGVNLTDWATITPATKEDTLLSGINIKTINGSSVLGAGNLVVSGAGSPMVSTTIDLGATPICNGSVTIIDASISATSYIQIFIMGGTTIDNDMDAHLHAGASWKFIPVAAAGSFTLYIDALIDMCWGTFNIKYTYS